MELAREIKRGVPSVTLAKRSPGARDQEAVYREAAPSLPQRSPQRPHLPHKLARSSALHQPVPRPRRADDPAESRITFPIIPFFCPIAQPSVCLIHS